MKVEKLFEKLASVYGRTYHKISVLTGIVGGKDAVTDALVEALKDQKTRRVLGLVYLAGQMDVLRDMAKASDMACIEANLVRGFPGVFNVDAVIQKAICQLVLDSKEVLEPLEASLCDWDEKTDVLWAKVKDTFKSEFQDLEERMKKEAEENVHEILGALFGGNLGDLLKAAKAAANVNPKMKTKPRKRVKKFHPTRAVTDDGPPP